MSAAPDGLFCPVLAYHSQNVFANHYGQNDHLSLSQDLRTIQSMGLRVVPLQWLVDGLLGKRSLTDLTGAVCVTFDDGCNLDVYNLEFPGWGPQQSFVDILKEFRSEFADQGQADLQVTSFVIASPRVRQQIDQESLFGKNWMSDDWWAETQLDGVLDIQNHGWDHKHPTQDTQGNDTRKHFRFDTVDTFEECELQVREAAEYIAGRAQRSMPQFFAYPYGKSSAYMRETYFPEQANSQGIEAAFSTVPEHVTLKSERWAIPRYVCGRDWNTSQRFEQILNGTMQHEPQHAN
jgi:peptidoglycan/xylan/chitin deacetylase (PgdA/CDA1 family)